MYYYILNPVAGGAKLAGLQDKLKQRLDELGISGQFVKTTGLGDATKLAKQAVVAGATTIVAVGGDDTVNEVINGARTADVAIGVIPLGERNRLAEQLGITDWQQACAALASRRLVSYSLIAAGQHAFLSTLTIGRETEQEDTSASKLQAILGLRQQLRQAKDTLPLSCHITLDDAIEIFAEMTTLTITNQKFLNPLLRDKLVISWGSQPTPRLVSLAWQKLTGNTEELTSSRFTANRAVIETKPATEITIDGKLGAQTPIAIRLTGRKVRFVTARVQ